ncbi:MAG TPA: hypothetical protein DCZ23_00195, partial [Lachnospiraceae bacterium]|nr:hypothetical protein [Lachnospiraceae bacterium]
MKKENETELLFGETIHETEESSRKTAKRKMVKPAEKKISPFKKTIMKRDEKPVLGHGLKIIPLGGLEQIG